MSNWRLRPRVGCRRRKDAGMQLLSLSKVIERWDLYKMPNDLMGVYENDDTGQGKEDTHGQFD